MVTFIENAFSRLLFGPEVHRYFKEQEGPSEQEPTQLQTITSLALSYLPTKKQVCTTVLQTSLDIGTVYIVGFPKTIETALFTIGLRLLPKCTSAIANRFPTLNNKKLLIPLFLIGIFKGVAGIDFSPGQECCVFQDNISGAIQSLYEPFKTALQRVLDDYPPACANSTIPVPYYPLFHAMEGKFIDYSNYINSFQCDFPPIYPSNWTDIVASQIGQGYDLFHNETQVAELIQTAKNALRDWVYANKEHFGTSNCINDYLGRKFAGLDALGAKFVQNGFPPMNELYAQMRAIYPNAINSLENLKPLCNEAPSSLPPLAVIVIVVGAGCGGLFLLVLACCKLCKKYRERKQYPSLLPASTPTQHIDDENL